MRITVLRGGPGAEHHDSLESGAAVLGYLADSPHEHSEIYIDPNGEWYKSGVQMSPAKVLPHTDLIWNALHGEYGEDGALQRLLEIHGVNFTGPESYPAASSYSKVTAHRALGEAGVRTPHAMCIDEDDDPVEAAREVFETFNGPYIVKPIAAGVSNGVAIATGIAGLAEELSKALPAYGRVLVENLVEGKEIKVGVIEGMRGVEYYTLPPVLVGKGDSKISDPMSDAEKILVPAPLKASEKQAVEEAAVAAHKALGLGHYSMVDMILSKDGPIVLEADSLPHIYEDSYFQRALTSVGLGYPEFIEHVIGRAT